MPALVLTTLRNYIERDTKKSLEQQKPSQFKVSDERPRDNESESEATIDSSTPLPLYASRPLYVLPDVPARALPTLRSYPLRWLALLAFGSLARKKRQLAESSPNILFVESPALKDFIDYESQHGQIWEQRSHEEVLLSLRDIRNEECSKIEEAMKEYYHNESESNNTVQDGTPLFELSGMPGNKIFCADRIHPNEAGYDYWGRHIANAIIHEWTRKKVD
jgi:hypothetical protein